MMVDESRNPLEFDAVVRRFADSTAALAKLRHQLQELTQLRDSEERTNQSLQDSASETARFTVEAAGVLKGLEDALAKAVEVLNAGGDLISGAELKGITDGVASNAQSIAQVEGQVDALDSKVTELTAIVVKLEASIRQDVEGLKGDLRNVLAAAQKPIIVKRFF